MRTFVQKAKTTQLSKTTSPAKPNRMTSSQSGAVRSILHLQHPLQSNANEVLAGSATAASTRFGHNFNQIPLHADRHSYQPKLKVAAPGDKYEQEADRVAELVMRMFDEEAAIPRSGRPKTGTGTRFLNSNLIIQQKTEDFIQCKNDASTSGFQLRSPFLEGTMFRPFASGNIEVPHLTLALIEQQLDPEVVIRALVQIDPSTSVPISIPEQASPIVTAGPNPERMREGSASDVFRAIAAIPIMESYLEQLQGLVIGQLQRAWGNLSTLERLPVITVGGLIGIGALAGVFANQDTRQWALGLIGDQVFPVPGVRGLSIEFALDAEGNNFRIGFHLDIGALLPESLGFGESSPTAIGAPPAPHNWESRPEEQEGEKIIRPKLESTAAQDTNVELEEGINSLRGGGQLLSENNLNFFESRFGRDFSSVRVHNKQEESTLADGLNARAFTIGKDIVFGAGQYRPESNEGKMLIAHELTHVVQQTDNITSVANTIQREESQESLYDMVGRPHVAMERWSRLNANDRTAVLSLMRQAYGESFAIRFEQTAQQMRLPINLHSRNYVRSRETLRSSGWEMIGLVQPNEEYWVHIAGYVMYLYLSSESAPAPEPSRQQRPPERLPDDDFGEVVQESLETHIFVTAEDEPLTRAGMATRYQDGTIEFYPYGIEGCRTYRPVPGSPGDYAVYDIRGRLMGDPLGIIEEGYPVQELDLARIFH